MMRDPRGSIDCTFEHRPRIGMVDHFVPSCVCIRTRFEQCTGGADKCIRAGGIETQITRKAEVCQRIPIFWSAFCGGAGPVARQKFTHTGFIGQNRRDVDIGPGHAWIAGKDQFRLFERSRAMRMMARNAGGANESRDWILERHMVLSSCELWW